MLVRRLAIISLLTGSVMVAAACGDTVTNVEPTAETVGVDAELVEFFAEEDDVSLRLRHFGAVEDDHPLIEESGERFVEDEDIGVVQQGRGDEHLLAHTL